MHGFEKNRLRLNYVELILILYFDEEQRAYDCSWILKNIGSVFFLYIHVIFVFWA